MDDMTMYEVTWVDKNGDTKITTVSSTQLSWFQRDVVEAEGGRVTTKVVKQDTITVTK